MNKEHIFLPRKSPESEGVSPAELERFYRALDESDIEFHHVTVIRHGNVISQGSWFPYQIEFPHMAHSLTKIFTNTAVGIACEKGLFSLDDPVAAFFPEAAGQLTDEKAKNMRVYDLITMRCGHDHLISGNQWRPIKTSWVAEFFKEPLAYQPGEHFQYTSATSYILSAIVQKTTRRTTAEFLQEELLDELGITGMTWDRSPQGVCSGGNGITIRNEDAAKIGLLYLNDGCMYGKRYLSHEWVQEAMVNSCRLNPDTGYGFHLTNERGVISTGGIFGQTVVLIPKYDMVLSINAANQGNRPYALDAGMRELIETHLFPSIREAPLPTDGIAEKHLTQYLSELRLIKPSRTCDPEVRDEKSFSGTYQAEENEDQISVFSFDFERSKCVFTLTDHRGTHSIEVGNRTWIYSQSSMTGNDLHHQYQPDSTGVAGIGWWQDRHTFVMKWVWYNMTFVDTVVCHFAGESASFVRSVNVNTQSKIRAEIIGHRIGNVTR